ncbi:hypothetical protein GF377_06090 [candidate division GN15 bacterium]|nr:hypothetical protein [candidate division GN15 bacterium]
MSGKGVVVVLEDRDHRNLSRVLTQWGYSMIVVDDMIKALDRIDHYDLAAAIVNHDDMDALEFVLNVRELDETLPVIIIGSQLEQDVEQVLRERQPVYFVSTQDEDFRPKVRDTLAEAGR